MKSEELMLIFHFGNKFDVNVLNVLTLRKFSMSEALPVIFFLHFGHRGWVRPNLNRVDII